MGQRTKQYLFPILWCLLVISVGRPARADILYDGTQSQPAKTPPPARQTAQVPSNVYTNHADGYTVTYPKGWEISEMEGVQERQASRARLMRSADEKAEAVITVASMRFPQTVSSSSGMKILKSSMAVASPKYIAVKDGTISVRGQTIHWHLFRGTEEDIPTMNNVYSFGHGQMSYAMTCVTEDDMAVWQRHRATFDAVAQSFLIHAQQSTPSRTGAKSAQPAKLAAEVFTDYEDGYSVVLPTGWVVEKQMMEYDGKVVCVAKPKPSDVMSDGTLLTVQSLHFTGKVSTKDALAMVKERMSFSPGYKAIKDGTVTVKGRTWHWHLYRDSTTWTAKMIKCYILTYGKRGYAITCATDDNPEKWKQQQATFDAVIQSFQMLEPKP